VGVRGRYLFVPASTKHGALRKADRGHPRPYNIGRILLEVGNERMPGKGPASNCAHGDCVEAFFNFAEAAQKRADELGLGKLPLVLALYAWGLFDPASTTQKSIIQRAAKAGLEVRWDQHVGGMSMNAPYKLEAGRVGMPGAGVAGAGATAGSRRYSSYAYGFYEMGGVTQTWQADALGKPVSSVPGVRTVVFEENGEPGWKNGSNIHDLARGIGKCLRPTRTREIDWGSCLRPPHKAGGGP